MIFLTRRERTTLAILTGCALLGVGANVYRQHHERVHVQLSRAADANRRLDEALDAARRVSLNAATAAELERLPGIGPALAARIVAYRQAHGPFASVEELRHVAGIGPALLAQLQDDVTL